ncbi:MAG: hypothetical protein IKJ01_00315 [Lachnospiraceae bacterium]|nr:hypothetical protein [Lachnospiraceae bacterium]
MTTEATMMNTIMSAECKQFEKIQEELYKSLKGIPITLENLATALQRYFPNKSQEELKTDCYYILEGIEQGEKAFDEVKEKAENGMGTYIEILEAVLKDKTPVEKREQLLLLYRTFCDKNNYTLSSEDLVYLNSLSNKELLYENANLLSQEGMKEMEPFLKMLKENEKQYVKKAVSNTSENLYTENESRFISAVAFYALESVHNKITPIVAGQQAGFWSRCKDFLVNKVVGGVLPVVISIFSLLGSYIVASKYISFFGDMVIDYFATLGLQSALLEAILEGISVGLVGLSSIIPMFLVILLGAICVIGLFSIVEKYNSEDRIKSYLKDNSHKARTYVEEHPIRFGIEQKEQVEEDIDETSENEEVESADEEIFNNDNEEYEHEV